MSDPASCIPPNPEVSGWWWLKLHDYEGAFKWSSPDEQGGDDGCWLHAALDGSTWTSDEATRAGYRILGPVPSHADVVEARGQIAQDGKEIERLEAELTAANAAIETLEALRDGDAHALRQLDALLTAANAEIARLKAELSNAETDNRNIESDNEWLFSALAKATKEV